MTGAAVGPGDAIIGLPSSGVHSNGFTLARRALPDLASAGRAGRRTVGETLLEPTVIYVRAVRELLASEVDVRGLAHITGEGLVNLLRLEAEVGYRIDSPLPCPPVFEPDRRPRRHRRARRCTRSSTWVAASAAWCPAAQAGRGGGTAGPAASRRGRDRQGDHDRAGVVEVDPGGADGHAREGFAAAR